MLKDKNELRKLVLTLTELFNVGKETEVADLLRASEINSEPTCFDNWNGGTTYFSLYVTVSVDKFARLQERQSEIEAKIKEKAELILRPSENTLIGQVYIIPRSIPKIEWDRIADLFNKEQLIEEVKYLKDVMISVSTGGQRIQEVNDQYQKRFNKVNVALSRLAIENPNPFNDLWLWYSRWSSGMPQYKERRSFVVEMYGSLLNTLQEAEQSEMLNVSVNLTGWERLDRSVKEIRIRLKQSSTEEQFQAIGLLCRETIITLAQAIYTEDKHPSIDGTKIGKTDAKRMLEAYIAIELSGGSNENLRKYARASSDLANDLTHKRTANAKDASLCAAATVALVNLIGILEDRH